MRRQGGGLALGLCLLMLMSSCVGPFGADLSADVAEVPAGRPVPEGVLPSSSTVGDLVVGTPEGVGSRTYRYEMSTVHVDPSLTVHGNHVYITLPGDYSTRSPDTRYPVLYLLHGADIGKADQWFNLGRIEEITRGREFITVMPDGGNHGWYTDWAVQERGGENWETYHLDQIVPWVDRTFPTLADRDHRAVGGVSMGGFGAARYAQHRPDLFGMMISFSGLLALGDKARAALADQTDHRAWGDGRTTTDGQWRANDPSEATERLEDTVVRVYAGSGRRGIGALTGEDIEPGLRDTARVFAERAGGHGVDVRFVDYGIPYDKDGSGPGIFIPNTCDGGHDWPCWRYALRRALPEIDRFFSKS